MKKYLFLFPLFCLIATFTLSGQTPATPVLPSFKAQRNAVQFMVGEKPVLLRAGEWGNSSSADFAYMRPIWPKLAKMHLNGTLVPVYWELLEPSEGHFDFSLVDSIICSARTYEIKLVLLWFGSWKNSMSCYAPSWVKTDENRFPRARTLAGEPQEILTPFSEENVKADSRAFSALLRHIRKVDEGQQTVILVQVENEIGMLPEARDHGRLAEAAYNAEVPAELVTYLSNNRKNLQPHVLSLWEKTGFKTKGSWEQVFGKSIQTEELFMAWYFARYTDRVAAAGKAEYGLPMYVNAALNRPGYQPGQYPSAGPLPHLFDIWRAGAPHIDFLAPDIYFTNFAEWSGKYDRPGNLVFIPEASNAQSPANAFYVMAEHHAMGYSPFAIESLDKSACDKLAQAYKLLQELEPLILQYQGTGNVRGVLLDSTTQVTTFDLGDYRFTFKHEYSWPYAERQQGATPRYGGMIIKLADDEFIMAGIGLIIQFASRAGNGARAGIISVEEGSFTNGVWQSSRRLNGDQTHQGRHANLPGYEFSALKVKLYSYR
jgi:hypothetical protein